MPISLLVSSGGPAGDAAVRALTFDGMQRVIIGRSAGCDVRLPDSSVSHRHASIQSRGADFLVFDEGSTNGTFVGGVRVAARTSRVVRSGDHVRVGRVVLEVRIDQSPVTRDLANATRELALALVAQAMRSAGDDATAKVRVVEGADLDAALPLAEEGRAYVVGRGEECDLPLADADASREHLRIVREGTTVSIRDLGAKNGVHLGETALEPGKDTTWRPALVVRLGRTVLALEEPVALALSEIESSPDEALPQRETMPSPATAAPSSPVVGPVSSAPIAEIAAAPSTPSAPRRRRPKKSGWTVSDVLVMLAALSILGLSIAGLVWLLKG